MYQISIMGEGEKEKKRRLCVKMSSNCYFGVHKTGLKLDFMRLKLRLFGIVWIDNGI